MKNYLFVQARPMEFSPHGKVRPLIHWNQLGRFTHQDLLDLVDNLNTEKNRANPIYTNELVERIPIR